VTFVILLIFFHHAEQTPWNATNNNCIAIL